MAINKSLWISTAARFFLMHVIANNVIVWVYTVMYETVAEFHEHDSEHDDDGHHFAVNVKDQFGGNSKLTFHILVHIDNKNVCICQ